MRWACTVDLIAETVTGKDANGYEIKTETARTVFADKKSVKSAEFYQANQAGVKAELIVVVHKFDYQGETILVFESKRYSLVRTYEVGENLEIIVTGK